MVDAASGYVSGRSVFVLVKARTMTASHAVENAVDRVLPPSAVTLSAGHLRPECPDLSVYF